MSVCVERCGERDKFSFMVRIRARACVQIMGVVECIADAVLTVVCTLAYACSARALFLSGVEWTGRDIERGGNDGEVGGNGTLVGLGSSVAAWC